MLKLLALIMLVVLLELGLPALAGKEDQLSSPRVTNWGIWGDWADCNAEEFVVGIKLRTESPQGKGDDTALNGIVLLCAPPGSDQYNQIRSLEGQWGEWGRAFYCPDDGTVTGYQLRSESGQGDGDDTAANNLRLLCKSSSGNIDIVEGDGGSWGDWTDKQNCPNGQAVTGFRTQVEAHQGDGDDTSLNNIQMICNEQKSCYGFGQACEGWRTCCSQVCNIGTCTNPSNFFMQ